MISNQLLWDTYALSYLPYLMLSLHLLFTKHDLCLACKIFVRVFSLVLSELGTCLKIYFNWNRIILILLLFSFYHFPDTLYCPFSCPSYYIVDSLFPLLSILCMYVLVHICTQPLQYSLLLDIIYIISGLTTLPLDNE